MTETLARNATLKELGDLLKDQHARKVDVVASATKFSAENGLIRIDGLQPVIDEDGVTDANGLYRPTEVFDEGLSQKLGIPLAYVRRMRAERTDLWDANVNGWLHGVPSFDGDFSRPDGHDYASDERSFLLRLFRAGEQEGVGVARAFLSDRYSVMDNLDALVAALNGVRDAQVDAKIEGADLTERRMYVRVIAPEVKAYAETLLKGYRSPFTGETGADNPTVFAGFVISNSEVGGGAFTITPRMVVQVCLNGMTITKDALRAVHLGVKMEETVIRWSEDTQRKDLALITARARDAVKTFLDVEYMTKVITAMEEKAGKRITDVEGTIKVVSKQLAFDDETRDLVFNMFVEGGDLTAGGVMHAVTAAARVTTDADKAADLEASAPRALELAFAN